MNSAGTHLAAQTGGPRTVAIIAVIAILGWFVFGTACARPGSLSSDIPGQWQATNRAWHITLRSDKTLEISTIGPSVSGTYRLDSSGTLYFDLQDGRHFNSQVTMPDRNRMILSDSAGTTSFERVQGTASVQNGVLPPGAIRQVAPATATSDPDLRGALEALDPVVRGRINRCPEDSMSVPWSFSAIVAPAPPRNPLAQPILPRDAPTGPTIAGYQQYRLFDSPTVKGHYIHEFNDYLMAVSESDRLNGIDMRFQIDLYAASYRTYDLGTKMWSDWSTRGSFGNRVHFAEFLVERRNGIWTPRGTIYMQPVGMELHAVNCRDLPPLD